MKLRNAFFGRILYEGHTIICKMFSRTKKCSAMHQSCKNCHSLTNLWASCKKLRSWQEFWKNFARFVILVAYGYYLRLILVLTFLHYNKCRRRPPVTEYYTKLDPKTMTLIPDRVFCLFERKTPQYVNYLVNNLLMHFSSFILIHLYM